MVRKNWVSVGMLGIGLALMGPAFGQSDGACKFEVRTRSKVGYRGTAKYYIKGDSVRQEKRSGGGLELVMVSNDKGLFIRNKHSDYWFKYPDGVNDQLKDRLLGGPTGDVKAFLKEIKAKKVRQERIKNEPCTVYAYQYAEAPDKFRLWVSNETGKPLQMERDHVVRGTNKRDVLIVEYQDYDADCTLPDSLFRVPSGAKVHDVSRAMTGGVKTPQPKVPAAKQ